MSFNPQLYPSDIFQPTTPYVYFNTIPKEILDKVAVTFDRSLNTFTDSNGTSNIDQAFSFLDKVIMAERAKEEAFLQYLKNRTKDSFDINIPSLQEDWSSFVREVQSVLDFGDHGVQNLQLEYERLVKNQANYIKATEKGEEEARYEEDCLKQVSRDMKTIMQVINSGQMQNANALSSQILRLIVSEYGADLLEIHNNKISFNKSELAALVLTISDIVLKSYREKMAMLKLNHAQLPDASKRSLAENLDDDIKEQIHEMFNQFKRFPHIRKQMVANFGLRKDDRNRIPIPSKAFEKQSGELITDTNELTQTLFNMLSNYRFPESAFKVVQKTPNLAEVESLVKNVVAGALSVINTGATGAKPDNIIAYITGDLSAIDPFNAENRKLLDKISRLNTIIEKYNMDKKHGGLSAANTAEYYKMRREQWSKMATEIEKALKDLRDNYKFFSSCFVIEDSTKNYLSLYSRTEGGEMFTGPHGGSLGANLEDQLAKIQALTDAGGISMIDAKWLIAAIINSGPNMIASGLKSSIEDYLAMFAAILLFDSQLNIAEQATQQLVENLPSGSVQQIHLFSVNNGYYPLSFVLKLTRDSLVEGLEEARYETQRQGVEVEIYGYITEPVGEGKDAWAATAQAALNSTKIKMRFMIKLMNVIQNLLQIN